MKLPALITLHFVLSTCAVFGQTPPKLSDAELEWLHTPQELRDLWVKCDKARMMATAELVKEELLTPPKDGRELILMKIKMREAELPAWKALLQDLKDLKKKVETRGDDKLKTAVEAFIRRVTLTVEPDMTHGPKAAPRGLGPKTETPTLPIK